MAYAGPLTAMGGLAPEVMEHARPFATPSGSLAVGNNTVKTGPGMVYVANVNAVGATGTVTMYDGTDATGILIGVVSAAAGTSNDWAPAAPVKFRTGLFVVVAGGTSTGTVGYS